MVPKLQPRLVVIGEMGYALYLTLENHVYTRPFGSAYNTASGILAVNGNALVIANLSKSFNKEYLRKFDRSSVRILPNEAVEGPDTVSLFDLRSPNTQLAMSPISSECRVIRSPTLLLRESAFQDVHIHIPSMPSAKTASLIAELSTTRPKASFSCIFHAPDLLANPDLTLRAADRCFLVFLTGDQFEFLKSEAQLDRLLDRRIAVVTYGADRSACYVDGIPVVSYTANERNTVCGIGAADVFAGAFVATLLNTRRLSSAAAAATEVAVASTQDYGVERASAVRAELGPLEAWDRLIDLNLPKNMPDEPHLIGRESATGESGWITATGVFVVRDGQLLLIRKSGDRSLQTGVFYVPGGKALPSETPEQCARRELQEETGLHGGTWSYIGAFHFQDRKAKGRCYLFHQFLVSASSGSPRAASDALECSWHPIASLQKQQLFPLTWAQVFLGKATGLF